MEEPLNIATAIDVTAIESQSTRFDALKRLVGYDSDDTSPIKTYNPQSRANSNDSDDEDQAPMPRVKKRIQRFTDSDSDAEIQEIDRTKLTNIEANRHIDSNKEHENISNTPKTNNTRSRIQLNDSGSDSPTDWNVNKNHEQQMRMKNKRIKVKHKFKSLLSSREKRDPLKKACKNDESENSDSEISSIKIIKQKIKESMSLIPSICDPDTSDEENGTINKNVNKSRPKTARKSTKLTSPKPMRMSAKQAMDNMHKIKSESNRMLREKEVSLPYHRPKALTLKDIMSRRKPAVTSDGKALPIKMNEEQLKQYAQSLEQRQKEIMDLCKSDTEDEETIETDNTPGECLPETEEIFSDSVKISIETNMSSETSDNKSIDITDAQTTENVTNEDKNSLQNDLTVVAIEPSSVPKVNLPDKDEKIQSINIDVNDKPLEEENTCNTDMKLVYNDSVEETNDIVEVYAENVSNQEVPRNIVTTESGSEKISSVSTEPESQLIDLHYDTEKSEKNTEEIELIKQYNNSRSQNESDTIIISEDNNHEDPLSDDDINMEDIDKIIENAELIANKNVNSPMLIKEQDSLINKPKLGGAPGMVIDLDSSDPVVAKRLSGIELLKERFTYFAQLKTPEEIERAREKKSKPGVKHLKLKLELEEKIAEQRSLEWAKRLEEEKLQHTEMNAIRGDTSDLEDDIEKIEAKLSEIKGKQSSSESEEELEEDDVEIKDKPRKHNPMLDDEAGESECDGNEVMDQNQDEVDQVINGGIEEIEEGDETSEVDEVSEDESDESSDESSESEEERPSKPKKGRILKAFEDSDEESNTIKDGLQNKGAEEDKVVSLLNQAASQDDELQLAQRPKSMSDEIFSSQDALSYISTNSNKKDENNTNDLEIATQTFSILDSKPSNAVSQSDEISDTQPYHDPNLAALASGLTQNVINSQLPSQASESQAIGEDVLALCTGKFYDNEFVSQADENCYVPSSQESCTDDFEDDDKSSKINKESNDNPDHIDSIITEAENNPRAELNKQTDNNKQSSDDGHLLKSILDELDDPEFDAPKPNKFFTGASQKKDNVKDMSSQAKKKFIIESDDEADTTEEPKRKKLKKKKPEMRALQISDDEEEDEKQSEQDDEEYISDIEDDTVKNVEYDSEENEIEVKPQKLKKKRTAKNFFEQEAELTSEDEWVGSGDEDEAGLDQMEREEGDDEVFHQGKLQKELGQIHMRDVLDQDKREVRLLQELLFEDGDLGDGHRQRKFRWRNADGDEETGTMVDEFGDTQEEEFESEEQWRKQRHERAVFLRQMQNKEEEDFNVSVDRTTIIKANLSSKSMSSLLLEVNQSKTETIESPMVPEKKTPKDIPSPKKSFAMFKQNYHGSLLTRGKGALARLAALATPLAADDDAPKIGSLAPSSKRNFVFAALTPDEKPKVTMKRKADTNVGTPKLVKKMKAEDSQNRYKNSLIDHLKAL